MRRVTLVIASYNEERRLQPGAFGNFFRTSDAAERVSRDLWRIYRLEAPIAAGGGFRAFTLRCVSFSLQPQARIVKCHRP